MDSKNGAYNYYMLVLIISPIYFNHAKLKYIFIYKYKRGGNKLKKTNYLIDVALFFSFLIVFFTGLIKWRLLMDFLGVTYLYFILPMGSIRIWHEWSSIVMSLLVWIHLILHWKWIINTTRKIFKKSNSS